MPNPSLRHPRYLNLLVFVAGLVTLGLELAAARLLDPYFGNSILVWATLIGLVLACLSLGYWLGGRLADRRPSAVLLYGLALAGALLVALIPAAATPVLQAAALSTLDLEQVSLGLLAGAGMAILVLISLPTLLLGCVSPFAIRLALADVRHGGQVAGRLYALSTTGSLLGTFLPVLVLIPAVGTRLTFVLLGGLLALTALGGLLLEGRRRAAPTLLALPLLALLGWTGNFGAIKPEPGLLLEGESLYNYYQVVQRGPETWLKLNEGIGLHSVYHPQSTLSNGIWDYFLIAPLFASSEPVMSDPDCSTITGEIGAQPCVNNLYLVGLAGGTVAQLYTKAYGPLPIDGVELDPEILQAARDYFHLAELANLNGVAADGRSWLARQPTDRRYSVIALDAYRPPYIPFHLTSVEFFQLVRDHLDDNGVVAVNAARSRDDYSLVNALAATMAQVFPSVYAVDESTDDYRLGNTLLVATRRPTSLADWQRNREALETAATLPQVQGDRQLLKEVAARAQRSVRPLTPGGPILTDDRAPIEQIIHGIMLRYLLGS